MKNLILIRKSFASDNSGVFGSLTGDKGHICHTFELPWLDNKTDVSCIPPGSYKCRVKFSKRLGRVFEIIDVPGRSDILIHVGNSSKDTKGCILVGASHGDKGVTQSRMAMGHLLIDLPNTFTLNIIDVVCE